MKQISELQEIYKNAREENRLDNYAESEKFCREILQEIPGLLSIENSENQSVILLLYAQSLRLISESFWRRGLPHEAIHYAHDAVLTAKEANDDEEIARSINNVGVVYSNLSEFSRALEYYEQAIAIFEKLGNEYAKARVTANIGIIHAQLFDYPRALEYIGIALAVYEGLGDRENAAIMMGNLGNVYENIPDYPMALEFFGKALAVHEELGMKGDMARVLGSMGLLYVDLLEYNLALEYYGKALALDIELDNKMGIAAVTSNIGALYANKQFFGYDAVKSEEYLKKAIILNEKDGRLQFLCANHMVLSKLYNQEERWQEAYEHFIKFYDIEKEIFSEQKKQQADKHAYERQIVEQEKKIAVEQARNEEISKQKDILESQAAKIQLKNTELQETNIKLDSANNLLTEQAAKIQLTNTELQEKNIELNRANRQLEEANDFKMKILGIASHDLKNPITALKLYAHLLRAYTAAIPDATKMLDMIAAASKRMLDIVVNLIDIAARELGQIKLTFATVDVSAIVADVVAEYIPRASEKKQSIEFSFDTASMLEGDDQRLRQVFDNLISNAVKYSDYGKEIRVSITTIQENVIIAVKDQGQGLSEEDKTLLFKDFQKLSARPTGGEGSTGLGLSVVKHLVELHGGMVWAESEGKGMGSTFFVELPKKQTFFE